jgi:hypothetical protein
MRSDQANSTSNNKESTTNNIVHHPHVLTKPPFSYSRLLSIFMRLPEPVDHAHPPCPALSLLQVLHPLLLLHFLRPLPASGGFLSSGHFAKFWPPRRP